MKSKITNAVLILLCMVLTAGTYLRAQNPADDSSSAKELNHLIYNALVSYNKDMLLNAREKFAEIIKNDSSNSAALYNLTFSEYKLLEMSLQKENGDLFDRFYDSAINHANDLTAAKGYSSEGKTLLAAVYMMKIAASPMSAVTLSQEIQNLLDDAEEINSKNPEAYMIRGIMFFKTPPMYGGSYEEAVNNFKTAETLFEKDSDPKVTNTSWGKLEALAWLGRSFVKLNNPDAAKFAYKKALSLEPNYGFVKYVLLPDLDNNSSEQ